MMLKYPGYNAKSFQYDARLSRYDARNIQGTMLDYLGTMQGVSKVRC